MVDLITEDVGLTPRQLIAPDGSADPTVAAGIEPERLVWLYETMYVTRHVDEELVNLQRQGQLALYPSCRGQEAAQIGAAAAVGGEDWLFPQYRELGVYIVRGIDPAGVGLMWRGAWHGGLGFVERSVAPMAIPIGTHALHAVGSAMASMRLGDELVSVAFIGDGSTSTGDVHEAMNVASVQQAPCVFYVQNNGWAISVPISEQLHGPSIAHRGIGYGIPAVRVDGNDVLACMEAMAEAVARARSGRGPSLIEAVTYRLGPHTTSDDPTRYRTADEVAAWTALDPIERFQRFLQHRGIWNDDVAARAEQRATEMRRRLRDAVFDAPDPDPMEMFDHVFRERTAELDAQRELLATELADRD